MKKYVCNYTHTPVFINGDLSKPEWELANRVELVDVVSGNSPKQQTVSMLLWDDNFLYVAFDCVDHEIIADMKNYNEPLYEQDVVEIFIDDDDNRTTYIELEVNPNNAVLHYMIYNKGKSISKYARVDKTVTSAVKRESNRTLYEIAIPVSEFSDKIHDGSTWKFNLYRIDRGEFDEYTAFSPTGEVNYHRPDKFAEIGFKKN